MGCLLQAGVSQVHALEEMYDAIQAFTYLSPLRGRRVGVVGVGGGFNVLAADSLEAAGLFVPELPRETRTGLRKFTPSAGTGVRNPVDTLTDAYLSPSVLAKTVSIVASLEGIDVVPVVFPAVLGVRLGIQRLRDAVEAAIGAARAAGKPIALVLRTSNCAGGESVAWQLQRECADIGVSVYFRFAQAGRALNHLVSYHENRLRRPLC
jgi:acyl-CoA synthetase (NDP forming)